jgi:hypothetical protein
MLNSKKMNANPYKTASVRPKAVSRVRIDSNTPNILSVDPPAQSKNWMNSQDAKWINHYDEEWAAFIKEHAMKKTSATLSTTIDQLLPRVWNRPHS